MFGADSKATPPEHGFVFDQMIQPDISDHFRCDVVWAIVVIESAGKDERSADVIIGDDKRHTKALVNVVVNLADSLFDLPPAPSFEGSAEINADQFSKNSGVDTRIIVGWQVCHCYSSLRRNTFLHPLTVPEMVPQPPTKVVDCSGFRCLTCL